jgi:hypothetical protein
VWRLAAIGQWIFSLDVAFVGRLLRDAVDILCRCERRQ